MNEFQYIEYIKDYILDHFLTHRIKVSDDVINDLLNESLNGNFAFQIIYSDSYEEYPFFYKFKLYKILDHTKLLKKDGDMGLIWSYDSGRRYQWGDSETLKLNNSIIRDIKLKQIGL
jgi:hypothetical protein